MDQRRPSVTGSLFRFFGGSERDRELENARSLYAWVRQGEIAFSEDVRSIATRVYRAYRYVPEPIDGPLLNALCWVIESERYLFPVPPPAFDRMSMTEFVAYKEVLHKKQHFLLNQRTRLEHLEECLFRIFDGIAAELPVSESPSPFTIPLVYAVDKPGELIQRIIGTLGNKEYVDHGVLMELSNQLIGNVARASGRDAWDEKSSRPWKRPQDSDLPLPELVDTYLADTPFHAVFTTPVPLKLTHDDRFSHMHILGGTGAGKTSLIEHLLLHDIQSEEAPSLVIIDPHGDLIRKLKTKDLGIEDRLVIIDPRDIDHPPALNVFAQNAERMASYDRVTREQVTAGVIETFDYLFAGLVGADLTAKQGVFFKYLARFMLGFPETMGRNATILDMIGLMREPPRGATWIVPPEYQPALDGLTGIPRDFFMRDFSSKTFAQTKEQIRYRLMAIIENPTLARLFTSQETKVDLFAEMNRGSIILVDTAKDFLKGGSSSFGRIFIALVLQAIMERAAMPATQRRPTFLYVDEAATYFSENIDDLLTEVRKYGMGAVFAHQHLEQATHGLRASLAANTASKFVCRPSATDARAMASDMRTTPDFLLSQPKFQFATYIRGVTPHAVAIPIEWGALEDFPNLSPSQYEALVERNRARVSAPLPEPETSTAERAQPHAPFKRGKHQARAVSPIRDEDISYD